jgi:hypothetical protein
VSTIGATAMLTAICVVVDIRFGGLAGTGLDGTKSNVSSIDIDDIDSTEMILACMYLKKKARLTSRVSTG